VPFVLFVAGLGAAVLFMLGIGRAYWNRRVAKWADEHALALLDFRGAGFFEGRERFAARTTSSPSACSSRMPQVGYAPVG